MAPSLTAALTAQPGSCVCAQSRYLQCAVYGANSAKPSASVTASASSTLNRRMPGVSITRMSPGSSYRLHAALADEDAGRSGKHAAQLLDAVAVGRAAGEHRQAEAAIRLQTREHVVPF